MGEKQDNLRERSEFIATEVTPDVRAAIKELADLEDRSISYMTWKLLQESPRVKERIRQLQPAA